MLERELPDVPYSHIPYHESFNPDFTALELTNYDVEFYTLVILTADSYTVPSIMPLFGAFEYPL